MDHDLTDAEASPPGCYANDNGTPAMAPVTVLHQDVCRPQGPPSLAADQALELALLGITMAQPMGLERVADLLQRIAAPLLRPTAEVIECRSQDLARRGLLAVATDRTGRATARRTAAGVRHARQLLWTPGPPHGAAHHDLVFMLKTCLLDLLAEADRAAVIDELRRDLSTALAAADHAARHCRSSSPFAHHWLERQVSRLQDDIHWLDTLARVGPD